jgi:uncharacterized protein YjbI with pentapeptide repeats
MGNKNSRTSGTKEAKTRGIALNPKIGETPSDKLLRLLSISEKNEPCDKLIPTVLECIIQKANADVNNAIYTKFANADKNNQAESQLVYLMDEYLPGGKPYTLDNLYDLNLVDADLSYDNTADKLLPPYSDMYFRKGLNFSRAPPGYIHIKDAIIDPYYINDLTKLNMKHSNLIGSNFNCANLTSANLSKSDMNYAQLQGAILTNAILTDTNLSRANLTGANLRGAHLSRAKLDNALLSYADLRGAYISNSNLSTVSFFGAKTNDRKLNRLYPNTILLPEENRGYIEEYQSLI